MSSDQWQPFVHVDDAAQAILTCLVLRSLCLQAEGLEAPLHAVKGQTFNVGEDHAGMESSCVPSPTAFSTMNETELLDSLHDSQILAIKGNDSQVIIELDYVDRWEPQDEAGHYRLIYVPARLIFEGAEIVAQTGDYARLDELPNRHAARTVLWVDIVDDASADSGYPVYHFITPGDGSLAIRAKRVRLER